MMKFSCPKKRRKLTQLLEKIWTLGELAWNDTGSNDHLCICLTADAFVLF